MIAFVSNYGFGRIIEPGDGDDRLEYLIYTFTGFSLFSFLGIYFFLQFEKRLLNGSLTGNQRRLVFSKSVYRFINFLQTELHLHLI